jgi:5-(carboxyamino)imidazole ribonucleotide synthase
MKPILPGGTIGILGGGQLGRMIALEAHSMGYRVAAIDPDSESCLGQIADSFICAPFDDEESAAKLAKQSDVVTLEFENVPGDTVAFIEKLRAVRPSSSVLHTIQDRLTQKQFLQAHGFPQTPFVAVTNEHELSLARSFSMPAILKTCRQGYDGKGQVPVKDATELEKAWQQLKKASCVLEAYVPFRREISVVLARGLASEIRAFPIAENVHRQGILHTTKAPATFTANTSAIRIVDLAAKVAEALRHVGVMAVEMFECDDGDVLVNEVAPRVHNSGHFTFGACATSQFEQHIRAVCGLPLGNPTLLSPVVMVNLLGDLWIRGVPNWELVLREPNMHLHLYSKRLARPGRKMGHVLIFDEQPERALAKADHLLSELKT